MAWDDEAPIILRQYLQDTADTPVYTDARLNTAFLVGALFVSAEVRFGRAYEVSVSNETLRPDPTSTANGALRDNAFLTISCLRAALMLVGAELRDLTRGGIEIQDGDNRIKLGRNSQSLKFMRDHYQDAYDEAVLAYKTNGGDGWGEAIVSPYAYFSSAAFGDGIGSLYEGYRGDRQGR